MYAHVGGVLFFWFSLYGTSSSLSKLHCQFSPLVILTARYQVWDGIGTFYVQPGEQIVLAVKTIGFGCYEQSEELLLIPFYPFQSYYVFELVG